MKSNRSIENAYNRLLHASTGASTVGVVSGVSTIGTDKCVIRRCEHRLNLRWCMLAVNI